MPNFSAVQLAGHLGRDAVMKDIGKQRVCEFSMAVTKKRKTGDLTAWYTCQIWGTRGETLAPMLVKGKAVLVAGELIPREYKNKSDELRQSLDVRVDLLEFLGDRERTAEKPAEDSDADLPF